MKDSTIVRLRMSKQLFESLADQILAEAKDMSGGAYTEAVKQSKGEKKSDKSEKNEDLNISKNDVPQVRNTKEPDENAPKVGSKQQLSTALKQTGMDLAKDSKANLQSGESNAINKILQNILDIADDPDNASSGLARIQSAIDVVNKTRKKGDNEINLSENDVPQVRKFEEMQTNIDEDDTMDFQSGAFDVSEMRKKKNIKENLRKGVSGNFEEWKKSFPEGTEFVNKNNYMVAMKDGKELGKWNPIKKQGMHADDFQYKNLEEKEKGVEEMETKVAKYYDSRPNKSKADIDKEFADRMKNDKEYQKLSKDIKDKASSLYHHTKPNDRRGMVGEEMDQSNINEYYGLGPDEVKALEYLAAIIGTGTGALIVRDYGKEIKDLAGKVKQFIKSKKKDKEEGSVAEMKKEEK